MMGILTSGDPPSMGLGLWGGAFENEEDRIRSAHTLIELNRSSPNIPPQLTV